MNVQNIQTEKQGNATGLVFSNRGEDVYLRNHPTKH